MSDDILVLSRCPHPDCADRQKQSNTFKRVGLGEMLQGNEVRVFGPICGHDWFLMPSEVAGTRKYLKETA
jgi:hypothetical protein